MSKQLSSIHFDKDSGYTIFSGYEKTISRYFEIGKEFGREIVSTNPRFITDYALGYVGQKFAELQIFLEGYDNLSERICYNIGDVENIDIKANDFHFEVKSLTYTHNHCFENDIDQITNLIHKFKRDNSRGIHVTNLFEGTSFRFKEKTKIIAKDGLIPTLLFKVNGKSYVAVGQLIPLENLTESNIYVKQIDIRHVKFLKLSTPSIKLGSYLNKSLF